MKLPTVLSRSPLPAFEIGLAPLTAELSPNPIDSRLPNGGRRTSRSCRGVVPDVCGESTPACCNADVRLEAWFRGEVERRLRLGVAISMGGKGADMADYARIVKYCVVNGIGSEMINRTKAQVLKKRASQRQR